MEGMIEVAILEKEILILLNPNNINYFENLNYEIPRRKDKKGRISVPRGTKLLVKVNDLAEGCNVKVTKVCDYCGKHIGNQDYVNILAKRKNSMDSCKKCASTQMWNNKKENVSYEKSLEFFSKKENKDYLLKEFSDKNINNASQVSYGTNDKCLWNCPNCKNEYSMSVQSRTSKQESNCPYCCIPSKEVLVGFNDLWTTQPEIAKLLKDSNKGYQITSGSNKRETFYCCECKFEQKRIVNSIVKQGFSCLCSDGIKYPEKFMIGVLNQLNIDYETQKTFNFLPNKRYDFYIPSLNCIIETHGEQHYKDKSGIFAGKSFEEEQENDRLKESMAKENGITNYIIIDCSISEPNFIKNNIIESYFSILLDLNIVDWIKCIEFTSNSLVKTVCELWNSCIDNTKEIGVLLKLSKSTVRKYLKQGTELGWCDYNPKIEVVKNGVINGKKVTKPVIQLTLGGDYIKTWNSAVDVEKELCIGGSHISNVCNGKRKTTGGFKWMFKSDYENMQSKVV